MKQHRLHRSIPGALALCLFAAGMPAQAENWADRTVINGFLSARYSVTNDPLFFQDTRQNNGINQDGSFRGTNLGLNVTSRISDRLTVASQLFSSIEDNNYATGVDWAFARFNLSDDFAVRVGKIKYPVGLVNEYASVGVTYPWIEPPLAIYSTSSSGPQATRKGYSGADVLWNHNVGDWTLGADLFSGQVSLTGMTVKKMHGITARADWNDMVTFQASNYSGKMIPDDPTTAAGMMMNNKTHSATVAGAKVDWNNFLFYGEKAKVKMDVTMMGVKTMDSDSWYATLGYRITDRILPHYTHQNWKQGDGDGHKISTFGINYSLSPNAVVKLEYSNIKTDKNGLFVNDAGTATGPGHDVHMTSFAVDVVF